MSPPAQTPARVFFALALGLLSISFSAILVRLANEAPGLTIAAWRTAFAMLVLAPAALLQYRSGSQKALNARQWGMTGAAAVLLALHFILWIESLYHTSVASASVLVSTTPIFLAVFGFLLLRERVRRLTLIAVAVGVAGAVLIGAGDAGSSLNANAGLGNGLALSASLAFAFYLLVGRAVRRGLQWLSYIFPLFTVVTVIILLTAIVSGTPLFGFSPAFYGLCLAMAIGPQVFGHGSFNYALRYLSPTLVGLLILLEPVVASVAAFYLFEEMPGPVALGGMGLVIGSIAIAVIAERGPQASPPT